LRQQPRERHGAGWSEFCSVWLPRLQEQPLPPPPDKLGRSPSLRGCSSVGRAPALQAGGHRFDSVHLHQIRRRTTEDRRQIVVRAGSEEAEFASGCMAAGGVVFDSVKREYLSSMMGRVDKATSVVRPLSSVVCSGEEPKLLAAGLRAGWLEASRVSSCETRCSKRRRPMGWTSVHCRLSSVV
jgi:hypothetical protein